MSTLSRSPQLVDRGSSFLPWAACVWSNENFMLTAVFYTFAFYLLLYSLSAFYLTLPDKLLSEPLFPYLPGTLSHSSAASPTLGTLPSPVPLSNDSEFPSPFRLYFLSFPPFHPFPWRPSLLTSHPCYLSGAQLQPVDVITTVLGRFSLQTASRPFHRYSKLSLP